MATNDNLEQEVKVEVKTSLKTMYFPSSDDLCKFVNSEREKGNYLKIVSIISLGSGSAYRLFYEG